MEQGQITPADCAHLARNISSEEVESIALCYLGFDEATIKNIRRDAGNSEAFSREVIQIWANKNPGENQKQVGTRCQL